MGPRLLAFLSSPILTSFAPSVEGHSSKTSTLPHRQPRDFPCRLMNETSLESALPKIHRRYNNRLTAATLGEEGVLAWDGNELHHAAAYRVAE